MNILMHFRHEYLRHRRLAEQAMAGLSDEVFFRRPSAAVNPVALIVKHLAGNFKSRWTDFLVSDGEKPWRDRDSEFILTQDDTRAHLLEAWKEGWTIFIATFDALTESDLARTVVIRGEGHTVYQALLRGLTHTAYHVGQILYLARWLAPAGPWLTIGPGQSQGHAVPYLKKEG